VRRIAQQPLKVIQRGVIEGEARGFAELGSQVVELAFQLGVDFENMFLGRL
jgi:hypothetical protein